MKDNLVTEISFYSEQLNVKLIDLELLFGEYTSGYNFRDDITLFVFITKSNRISQVCVSSHGNVGNNKDQYIKEFSFKLTN
ncbi:MAG: hypothetical protein JNL60_11420 [Bacteroidia bacterium]|nr:hypothetical protein [Bacteroidia bacterium]